MSPDDLARVGEGGSQVALFVYLGAKHMVTGYDHVLFLVGVMFLLRGVPKVLALATAFAVGHTVTLLSGVLFAWQVNPYLVDAIIGLSVAYKGYDNLGGWSRFERWPGETFVVGVFGLIHGLGLATKLQDFALPEANLVAHLVAFNVGVELGQVFALAGILLALAWADRFEVRAAIRVPVNTCLVLLGFAFFAYQLVMGAIAWA